MSRGRFSVLNLAINFGEPTMLISVLITFFIVVLVLYFISVAPLDVRGKQIASVAVIVLGVVSALKYLPIF
jgi:hypothetical protein